MKYSACIEWLFADESESFGGRIRLAKQAKLDAVEFWLWSNKNLDEIEAALAQTGLTLTGFVAEPMIALTDPANRARFLDGLAETVKVAKRFSTTNLIAQAGADQGGLQPLSAARLPDPLPLRRGESLGRNRRAFVGGAAEHAGRPQRLLPALDP